MSMTHAWTIPTRRCGPNVGPSSHLRVLPVPIRRTFRRTADLRSGSAEKRTPQMSKHLRRRASPAQRSRRHIAGTHDESCRAGGQAGPCLLRQARGRCISRIF